MNIFTKLYLEELVARLIHDAIIFAIAWAIFSGTAGKIWNSTSEYLAEKAAERREQVSSTDKKENRHSGAWSSQAAAAAAAACF